MTESGVEPVAPSLADPVVAALCEIAGGPAGSRRMRTTALVPILVLIAMTAFAGGFGLIIKQHCRNTGWGAANPDQFVHLCYTDIPLLFGGRHISDGDVPYFSDVPADEQVEYPVLTGAAMWVTGLFVPQNNDARTRTEYFDVNVLMLTLCLGVAAVATGLTARHRVWDGALVALSPAVMTAGNINWDLVAVAFTSLALWAWARSRPMLAGVLIGLGTAAKLYPLLLLGPILLLCLRAGRMRSFRRALSGVVAGWLVVNLPVMLFAWDAWTRFYVFSRERGAGFGSIWLVLSSVGHGVPEAKLNSIAGGLFLLLCLAIAALTLLAPRRPRLAPIVFLVVAAFLLTNKVYSPQYVVWLVPLAVLSRPRWRDLLIWQFFEVVHWAGTWLYFVGYTADPPNYNRALPLAGYNLLVIAHILATLWFAGLVVRDVLSPRVDIVRADGSDDPGGGVLDLAIDDPAWSRDRDRGYVTVPGDDLFDGDREEVDTSV